MKFFHLSDLHLGKHLHHFNLKEDQEHILREIRDYARKLHPDAIIIAGDIYDKSVPSAEAVTVFDEFLTQIAELGIPVFLIAGNHDSGERLDYASEILRHQNIYIAGKAPENEEEHLKMRTLQDEYGPVNIYLLPFFKPSYLRRVFPGEEISGYTEAARRLIEREQLDFSQRNVLVSHQFYTGNGQTPDTCDSEMIRVGGLDNVDISAVEDFDYVALGHIHREQQIGKAYIRYCGTPLKYSVSEVNHQKGLMVVTLKEKGTDAVWEKLPLHPLRDVKKLTGRLEEILKLGREGESENYVSVTLTDEEELYKPREQLQLVYPWLLEVHIDNKRTGRLLEGMEEEIQIRSPIEMFADFYREVHGTDPDSAYEGILKELLESQEEFQ